MTQLVKREQVEQALVKAWGFTKLGAIVDKNFFLVKRVPGWGPEQRESEKTVLYLQIIIILISYIIIKLLNY